MLKSKGTILHLTFKKGVILAYSLVIKCFHFKTSYEFTICNLTILLSLYLHAATFLIIKFYLMEIELQMMEWFFFILNYRYMYINKIV
jgi:hypothetical protein